MMDWSVSIPSYSNKETLPEKHDRRSRAMDVKVVLSFAHCLRLWKNTGTVVRNKSILLLQPCTCCTMRPGHHLTVKNWTLNNWEKLNVYKTFAFGFNVVCGYFYIQQNKRMVLEKVVPRQKRQIESFLCWEVSGRWYQFQWATVMRHKENILEYRRSTQKLGNNRHLRKNYHFIRTTYSHINVRRAIFFSCWVFE